MPGGSKEHKFLLEPGTSPEAEPELSPISSRFSAITVYEKWVLGPCRAQQTGKCQCPRLKCAEKVWFSSSILIHRWRGLGQVLPRGQPCSPKEPRVCLTGIRGEVTRTQRREQSQRLPQPSRHPLLNEAPYLLTRYCSEQPAPPSQGFSFSRMGPGTRSRG